MSQKQAKRRRKQAHIKYQAELEVWNFHRPPRFLFRKYKKWLADKPKKGEHY